MPMLSDPSISIRGIRRGLTAGASIPGIIRFALLWSSGGLSFARSSRDGTSQIAFIVFGLLIWSVLTSEVSSVPGCQLCTNWKKKLFGPLRLVNAFEPFQYWAPTVLER